MLRQAKGHLLAALGLAAALALASWGAATDSATVDEPSHLVAGYAALERGDFRLSPDHPPLARMLLALPLRTGGTSFLPPEGTSAAAAAAWRSGDFFRLGRDFFETWNDGQQLVRRGRVVAVLLLGLLLVAIYRVASRWLGTAGGTVALLAAAFDPNLLAHGHLATIDVPFALISLLTIWRFDAWLRRPDGLRLALAAAAFSAALLVKFSFFALLPALAAMALAARWRGEERPSWRRLALAGAVLAASAYLAIWAAYHFRFAAAAGSDAATATMHVLGDYGRPLPATPAAAWESVLHDPATGADRPGPAVPLLRFLHSTRLLPEAYLYGAAYVAKKGMVRASYLRGRYSMSGFPDYFAWAFAIKTPLATLALAALGLAALIARWRALSSGDRSSRRLANPPLVWGLLVFAIVYLAALHGSALNLGYRHLLPVMPLVWLLAGAAWPRPAADDAADDADASSRRRQLGFGAAVAVLLAWLGIGTTASASRQIGYFNESIGGWRQGHRYLADSNVDWGQDLLRLAERLRREPPTGPWWLAQASDPPLPRELAELGPRSLLGRGSLAPDPQPIAAGLYAISATELLGVYRPLAREDAWRDPRLLVQYEQLAEEAHLLRRGADPGGEILPYEVMRRLRLISRLARRPPDERVGTSLFLFRLGDREVAELTAP